MQIHLRCVVDRHDAVVLHDHVRKIRVLDGTTQKIRVAVDRAIEFLRPERKRAHDLARVQPLGAPGEQSAFIEVDDPVGQHFSVNTEIAYTALEQQ